MKSLQSSQKILLGYLALLSGFIDFDFDYLRRSRRRVFLELGRRIRIKLYLGKVWRKKKMRKSNAISSLTFVIFCNKGTWKNMTECIK